MAAHSSNEATMCFLGTQSPRLTAGMKDLGKLNINTILSSLPKHNHSMPISHHYVQSNTVGQIMDLPRIPAAALWPSRPRPRRRRDELKITHFATIYDEGELEGVLRRAQLALLNPQKDPKHFLDVDWNKHTNNKAVFSPNILSLEIQASKLPELEFYDLPGCIILADQDLQMSLTMKHIGDNDAEGRCIGVLTEANLVPPAKIPAILEILEGKKYPLRHPWFITKQLSQ
ncbi:hypothetical protein MBLNU13_g02765t3 [Cladosporium sp. NU13]